LLPTPTSMPQESSGVSITTVQGDPRCSDHTERACALTGDHRRSQSLYHSGWSERPRERSLPVWVLVNLIAPNGRVAGTSNLLRIAQVIRLSTHHSVLNVTARFDIIRVER
jgi:hypothetical protein